MKIYINQQMYKNIDIASYKNHSDSCAKFTPDVNQSTAASSLQRVGVVDSRRVWSESRSQIYVPLSGCHHSLLDPISVAKMLQWPCPV